MGVGGVAVDEGVLGGVGEELVQVAIGYIDGEKNSEAEEGHGEEHLEAGGGGGGGMGVMGREGEKGGGCRRGGMIDEGGETGARERERGRGGSDASNPTSFFGLRCFMCYCHRYHSLQTDRMISA